ncbi:MAG: phosphate ABC transporter permease subunit PstC [Pyrinomonadaceae bacterium]
MRDVPAIQHPVAPAADQAARRPPNTTPTAASRLFNLKERIIESLLLLAAFSSVAITVGIVGTLIYESSTFFAHVSLKEFLTDTLWTPLFASPRFGILPLVMGTLVTTAVALAVALPIGTVVAIYLSECAPTTAREIIKPALELLSAVPTVVYGYFALQFMSPLLQKLFPGLPTFNMLSAGAVMGIMIIPYVSSLSEDAMRAVPMSLREGAYALGANHIITALRVVYPAALSGIVASYILAISRAIGETMIVAIAAGMQPNLTLDPREPAATITAFIVQVSLGDLPHGSIGYQSIFAAGITLFIMTLVFNILGYMLRKRFREVY